MPRWFLLLNGVALAVMGAALLVMRLRERPLHRHLFGIVWALLCLAAGVTLFLMGQGYLTQPGEKSVSPPRSRIPEFPTGR